MSALATPPVPVPVPPAPSAAPLTPLLYRLSVAQYQNMGRLGILTPDDRVELLEGLLVEIMPKKPPHIFATEMLRDILSVLVPAGWFINSQQPVTTDTSEPEPDASVVRGTRKDLLARIPSPQDVALVVEVSDSSLAQDRGLKKRIFANAGIAVYWIVNLIDNQVEVYTDPTGPANLPEYRNRADFGPADEVPLVIDGKEIARIPVRDLLP